VGVKSISFVLRREVDGVTKPLKLGEFPAMTVMQAREAAEKANTQINTTGAVAISSAIAKRSAPTLKTALDDYIRIRQKTGVKPMRDSTASSMRDYFDSYLEEWQARKVSSIRTLDIVARHLQLTENNGPYAANRAMDYLSSVLGWAIYHYAPDDDHPLLPDNPVKVLTRRRQWNNEVRRQTYVAPAALPTFWQAVQELPEKAKRYHNQAVIARDCFIVSLFTGMRPYEIQRLRLDGVDLAKRVLRLEDTKNHDTFEIPFGKEVFLVLKRRIEFSCEVGSEYVFPASGTNPRGKRSTIHMRSYVEKIDEALGGFVSKDLRLSDGRIGRDGGIGNSSEPADDRLEQI
jgi:integrase